MIERSKRDQIKCHKETIIPYLKIECHSLYWCLRVGVA